MISFKELSAAELSGRSDARALLLAMAGGFATLLLGSGIVGVTVAFAVAAGAGVIIGRGLSVYFRSHSLMHEGGLDINSSPVPDGGPDGVSLGFVTGYGGVAPLRIPLAAWMRHAMIVGQSGVGKTVLGEWIMLQQIAAGGGLLWIDGKLDPQNLQKLWLMASWCGRGDDLLVINPGDPSCSNTYNPLLAGEPDEVAGRCLSLIPDSGANGGADYYRQSAAVAVAALVRAVQATGRNFNFSDIRMLLTNTKALEWLLRELKNGQDEEAAVAFDLWLDQYRRADKKTGIKRVDLDAIKSVFGGIGSRLTQFAAGSFGKVMNTYAPEVDLFDAVTRGKIVYVMLPTMGKGEAAGALGKMIVGDFRTSIARVQALPEAERPARPFLGFFDEAGSYVTQAWSRMFEQARSARLVMCPAFQTKSNLETLGKELRAMVAGNTLTKIFFQPGEDETAKWQADLIGKEMQIQIGRSTGASSSASSEGKRSDGASSSYNESLREGYKVSPDDLARLGQGECIVQHDGSNVYKVHVPRVTFDPAFVSKVGPFRLNHPAGGEAKEGLNLLARAREFLDG